MNKNEKSTLLNKLITKSREIKQESYNDPVFKTWKNMVERALIKIYGVSSPEYKHFQELRFYYPNMIHTTSSTHNYEADHLKEFRKDFKILKVSIKEYIEEIEEAEEIDTINVESTFGSSQAESNIDKVNKVFISHSSNDKRIIEEVIELLESIGIESNQIFCSSFEGYGIDLGENFLEALKKELTSESLVLFILSENFYKSSYCMCEMGAAWALSKKHIPILIPPFEKRNMEGVFNNSQCFDLDDSAMLNVFKEKIEDTFCIEKKLSFSTWERKRDRICSRLNNLIQKHHKV